MRSAFPQRRATGILEVHARPTRDRRREVHFQHIPGEGDGLCHTEVVSDTGHRSFTSGRSNLANMLYVNALRG